MGLKSSPDWLNLQAIRDFEKVGGRKVEAFDELSSEVEESVKLLMLLVSGIGDGGARRRWEGGEGGVVKRVEDCGRERR